MCFDSKSDIGSVEFKEKHGWMGGPKHENVSDHACTLFEMARMHLVVRRRSPPPFVLPPEMQEGNSCFNFQFFNF